MKRGTDQSFGQRSRVVGRKLVVCQQIVSLLPIVGALAAKIRQLARLAAIGGRRDMNPSDIGMSPWQVKRAREDLAGWSDDTLATAMGYSVFGLNENDFLASL